MDELLDILSTGHGEQLNPEFLLWANPGLAPSKLRLDHTHLAQNSVGSRASRDPGKSEGGPYGPTAHTNHCT